MRRDAQLQNMQMDPMTFPLLAVIGFHLSIETIAKAARMLKLTRDELADYGQALKRRAELQAELAGLKSKIDQLETCVLLDLVAQNKASATRYGWTFLVERANKSVAWKEEFIRVAGAEKAVQLALEGKGQGKAKLSVTPPADMAIIATLRAAAELE